MNGRLGGGGGGGVALGVPLGVVVPGVAILWFYSYWNYWLLITESFIECFICSRKHKGLACSEMLCTDSHCRDPEAVAFPKSFDHFVTD